MECSRSQKDRSTPPCSACCCKDGSPQNGAVPTTIAGHAFTGSRQPDASNSPTRSLISTALWRASIVVCARHRVLSRLRCPLSRDQVEGSLEVAIQFVVLS